MERKLSSYSFKIQISTLLLGNIYLIIIIIEIYKYIYVYIHTSLQLIKQEVLNISVFSSRKIPL